MRRQSGGFRLHAGRAGSGRGDARRLRAPGGLHGGVHGLSDRSLPIARQLLRGAAYADQAGARKGRPVRAGCDIRRRRPLHAASPRQGPQGRVYPRAARLLPPAGVFACPQPGAPAHPQKPRSRLGMPQAASDARDALRDPDGADALARRPRRRQPAAAGKRERLLRRHGARRNTGEIDVGRRVHGAGRRRPGARRVRGRRGVRGGLVGPARADRDGRRPRGHAGLQIRPRRAGQTVPGRTRRGGRVGPACAFHGASLPGRRSAKALWRAVEPRLAGYHLPRRAGRETVAEARGRALDGRTEDNARQFQRQARGMGGALEHIRGGLRRRPGVCRQSFRRPVRRSVWRQSYDFGRLRALSVRVRKASRRHHHRRFLGSVQRRGRRRQGTFVRGREHAQGAGMVRARARSLRAGSALPGLDCRAAEFPHAHASASVQQGIPAGDSFRNAVRSGAGEICGTSPERRLAEFPLGADELRGAVHVFCAFEAYCRYGVEAAEYRLFPLRRRSCVAARERRFRVVQMPPSAADAKNRKRRIAEAVYETFQNVRRRQRPGLVGEADGRQRGRLFPFVRRAGQAADRGGGEFRQGAGRRARRGGAEGAPGRVQRDQRAREGRCADGQGPCRPRRVRAGSGLLGRAVRLARTGRRGEEQDRGRGRRLYRQPGRNERDSRIPRNERSDDAGKACARAFQFPDARRMAVCHPFGPARRDRFVPRHLFRASAAHAFRLHPCGREPLGAPPHDAGGARPSGSLLQQCRRRFRGLSRRQDRGLGQGGRPYCAVSPAGA